MKVRETAISRIDTSVSTTATFDYNNAVTCLSESQRSTYLDMAKKEVDIEKPATIRSYGQDITKAVSRIADKIIDKTKSDKSIVAADLTNSLLMELDSLRVPSEKGTFWDTLKSLPIIRSIVKKTKETTIENATMGDNVREISEKFVALKADSMSQTIILDDLTQTCRDYIVQSREKVLALMVMYDEVKKKLFELENSEYVDMDELQKYRGAATDLSKKITSLATTEHLFQQNMLQIAALQGNFSSIIDKCENSLALIPVVRMQLAMSVTTENQRYGVETTKRFDEFTNEVLVQNMNILKENSVELAKLTETPSVKIETLKQTKETLIDMVKSVKEIRANGEEQREQIRASLKNLSDELNEAIRAEM